MTSLVAILDADDPRIEPFRNVRERDLVGRRGFIAEGRIVVEQLLASDQVRPVALLILRNRVAGLRSLIERVPADVPVFVADGPTFDAVAGFPVHRGVLALGERRAMPDGDAGLALARVAGAGGTVVAAVGIANHDNMGAIIRNAAAFGVARLLVDASSCDPFYRKAIRVSAGAALRMPIQRVETGEAAREGLAAAGFRCVALTPGGAGRLSDLPPAEPLAFFLGTEGEGLPPALIGRMEAVRIGMAPGFDSLNVATAAAIALHHRWSARLGGDGVSP